MGRYRGGYHYSRLIKEIASPRTRRHGTSESNQYNYVVEANLVYTLDILILPEGL